MVTVPVYVEGGGQGKDLKSKCRRGFREFFEKAGLAGHMPRIMSCGSRNDTLKDFRVALGEEYSDDIPLMLVDSEAPVQMNGTSWQHLSARDCWERPKGAQDEQGHLMVQCMEAWFLADVSVLENFYGVGFKAASLAKRDDIEKIPKRDVFVQLKSASRDSKKLAYDKGRHSFDLLAQIDPEKVISRSPFARQLVETLKEHLLP